MTHMSHRNLCIFLSFSNDVSKHSHYLGKQSQALTRSSEKGERHAVHEYITREQQHENNVKVSKTGDCTSGGH